MAKVLQKIFFVLLLFSPDLFFGQNNANLGQGVLTVEISDMPVIDFFHDTTQKASGRTIAIAKDSAGEYILKTSDPAEVWFSPEQLFLNYDIFIIRVDTVLGNWLHMYTNNILPVTMWVKKNPGLHFIPWATFLSQNVSSINMDPAYKQPVKTAPNDQSQTIRNMEEADCFKSIMIKGDWINIKTNPHCSDSKRPVKTGWIRWRMKNKLVISYALTG